MRNLLTTSMAAVSQFWDKNFKTVTGATVAAIVLAGAFYTRNPQLWWVPFLWLLMGVVGLFVFQVARAFVKALFSIVVTATLASMAIMTGSMFDPYSGDNLTWAFALWAGWAISLTYSFMRAAPVSRWSVLTWCSLGTYIGSAMVAAGFLSLLAAAITAAVLFPALFWVFYRVIPRWRINRVAPTIVSREDITDAVAYDAMNADWSFVENKKRSLFQRVLRKPGATGNYLVWDDKAYVIIPVFLRQELQTLVKHTSIRKRVTGEQYLAYMGKPIGPWLLGTVANNTPMFGVGGADVRVVFLDVNNANGFEPKLIGVPYPDSNKVLYMGIIPAGDLLHHQGKKRGKKNLFDSLNTLGDKLGASHAPLTQKQLVALAKKL